MAVEAKLDMQPLKPEDIPDPSTPAFQAFLDAHFAVGQKLAASMEELHIKDHWCGRISHHTTESVNALADPKNDTGLISNLTRKLSRRASQQLDGTAQDGSTAVSNSDPAGLYERFRRGLLEYHSENEREYIESCRETECLQVFEPHVAEVWRLTYVTPPPTSPRTFVVLLLSRELDTVEGRRSFMNISIPFAHPGCPEKQGTEKSRVRGRYVSVERVTEEAGGQGVEWRMATSSDAGGNIPRFVTNASLPSSISEDVPSFLKWMVKRFPG